MEVPIFSSEHVCRNSELEVEIPRIRYGKRQTLDTRISEETLLLAKYLRNEKKEWNPRIANLRMKSRFCNEYANC